MSSMQKPFCVEGCPVGVNIPGFIERIYQRDFDGAAKILKGTNMLPAICGRVCPQEVQCESKCILGRKGESVAIGALERFVGDYSIRNAKQPSTKVLQRKSCCCRLRSCRVNLCSRL